MMQGFKVIHRTGLRAYVQLQSRYSSKSSETTSIKDEWKKRRNIIFDNELDRQKSSIGRIEKVFVKVFPTSKEEPPIEMSMNKDLSTPNDCALHLSEFTQKTAALALVNERPWDMHKPLTEDCELKILTMQMPKVSSAINIAFWRSCSIILGAMIDSAFKDEIPVYLHSFPWPNLKSGSFVYDVVMDLPDWRPTDAELRAMSAQFVKITNKSLPFERLEVSEELALDMFQENPFKSKQIPEIAKANEDKIILYRIGDFIDISKGPTVGNTNIVGRSTVSAVHKIESEETDRMYRFQGIAIPRDTYLNHFAFGILEDRAKILNDTMWVPQRQSMGIEEPSSFVAQN